MQHETKKTTWHEWQVIEYNGYHAYATPHRFFIFYNNSIHYAFLKYHYLNETFNSLLNSTAGYWASTVLSITIIASYLYFNPIAFSLEFITLLTLGTISEAIRDYKESIAEYTEFSCYSIEYMAKIINISRWSIAGLNAAVTVGNSIMPALNDIVKKPASAFLATLFTHSYANIMIKVGDLVNWWQETENSNWGKRIKNIALEGLKNNVLVDAIQFASKKFLEENIKASLEYLLIQDDFFISLILRTNERFISSIITHHLIGPKTELSNRHLIIPLEAIFKAGDEIYFHINNKHFLVTIIAVTSIIAKEIFPVIQTIRPEDLNNEKTEQTTNDPREDVKGQQAELILPTAQDYNTSIQLLD